MAKKATIWFILLHLLIAQFGLNIYSFSCYCLSEIRVSLLPSHTNCDLDGNTLCCVKSKNITAKQHKHKDCGKKSIEYKSSDYQGTLDNDTKYDSKLFVSVLPYIFSCKEFEDSNLSNTVLLHIVYWDPIKKFIRYCDMRC